MLVYTSITKSYLPKARVLATSLKKFHPEWSFVVVFSDDLPTGFDILDEPFDEILMLEDLGIPSWKTFAFRHSVVELCTAVKGTAAELLSSRKNISKIMYLDPDIKVFNTLDHLDTLLNQYDILLTPHILDRENDDLAIRDNEISALKYGIYNLGFFAAKTSGEGLAFIQWWAERLRKFCFDDIPNGLFTDQKWCDLAPALFDNLHIVRDRGYNVATWNIAHRRLSRAKDNSILAGNVPLRFYHFTGYDSGAGRIMLSRYAEDQPVASEIWEEYGNDLLEYGQNDSIYRSWKYGKFENGEPITQGMRNIFKKREDLQKLFDDPYRINEPSYLLWWNTYTEKREKLMQALAQNEIKIVFFGASGLFKKALNELSTYNIKPDYVCDNDLNKHGKTVESYPIYSPDEILNQNNKYFVVITSTYVDEIANQLKLFSNVTGSEEYSMFLTLINSTTR